MKTLRQEKIAPIFVDSVPLKENMEQGIIYISDKYKTSIHLCLCGCKEETVLPLSTDGWNIETKDDKVTITPSVLQRFGCKSHYIITNGIANFV